MPRRREARAKLAAAVKASHTTLTEVFGAGPHDIEWAFEGVALYLLQRRPVTSSVARAAPA